MPDISFLTPIEGEKVDVAILIKENAAIPEQIIKNYCDELNVPVENVILVKLPYYKKFKVADGKKNLDNIVPALHRLKCRIAYVADANYAKILLKKSKVADDLGVVYDSFYKEFQPLKMMYGVNYRQAFYNESAEENRIMSLRELNNYLEHRLRIKKDPLENYKEILNIGAAMTEYEQLHKINLLAVDIETYGLDFWSCGLASISFAYNKTTAVSFDIDIKEDIECYHIPVPDSYVEAQKSMLRAFLESYKGTLVWHNSNYDLKVLIYELWMEHPLDQKGLLKGLEIVTRKFHDTKLIAYLCLNSTSRPDLSLKHLSREYMGNYAIDASDISQYSATEVLKYNARDAIATRWVFDKYWNKLQKDNQLEVYNEIFIPSVKVILQMELSGMPLDKDQVLKADRLLKRKLDRYEKYLSTHPIIHKTENALRALMAEKANTKLKKLRKTADDFLKENFNPGSDQQVRMLVYEVMGFEATKFTDSGAPSTKSSVLKGLSKRASKEHKPVLRALIALNEIRIIVNTFISAFIEKSMEKNDGRIYLHGSFNLGGTVSGRLSSSKPNMQNIPSTGSIYAKLVKSCFVAPNGWIMVGADFSSLEDRISALITKDPNKLKVYEDGYDGHCLRAYYYFSDDMPDINPNSVSSINSISDKYPKQRQDSKGPTFCLTYGGTRYALVETCGLPLNTAIQIEQSYHEMYEVSDQWVADRIEEAANVGYVTVAFGLRVRTPYLKRCVWGSNNVPKEAKAEARTAGNALGQSYGLLNNRASIEFQERVLNSRYAFDIKPIAHIHDSQYFLIRDNASVLEWFNTNLVECMQWQNSPEISHPNVSLGGDVEVYYPSWASKLTLPNNSTKQEIIDLCKSKK